MNTRSLFQTPTEAEIGSRFLFHLHPLAISAIMRTLTLHCQCGIQIARETNGNPSSYGEAKKMKLLTLHINYGCLPLN